MARYTLVGGIATAVHYAILLGLIEAFHRPPSQSAAIGALFGTLVAYGANRKITFSSAISHWAALPRFLAVALFGAGISAGLVWLGTTRLGWHYIPSQLAATLLALVVGYQFNRTWTFQHG